MDDIARPDNGRTSNSVAPPRGGPHTANAWSRPRDRVLLVDEWIETGAQATAAARLARDAGAGWVGVSVIVDGTTSEVRRCLNVRCLLRAHEVF